ncbi:MAG TPA: ABC transporter ATP-binding protein [Ramlibacter sp.]|nr:ABC transporter ATP-binding protein [Ramlibacter sp.]
MSEAILQTQGLVKRYGGLVVTDDVSIEVRRGELHAVIGPNGAGKTTLINQLCGEAASCAGRITFAGEDVTPLAVHARVRRGLIRSYQISSVFQEFTVRENVVFAAMAAKQGAWGAWMPMLRSERFCKLADDALASVELQAKAQVPASELSYGERRQLELAMVIAAEPRMLLLDEPMAGMSKQESTKVVALLQTLKTRYPILLIEHDMPAVFALADRLTVLVSGRVIFTGTPAEAKADPEVRAVYLG